MINTITKNILTHVIHVKKCEMGDKRTSGKVRSNKFIMGGILMINIENILKTGKIKGASDIHLINKKRPIFRINRELVEMYEADVLEEADLIDAFEIFMVVSSKSSFFV